MLKCTAFFTLGLQGWSETWFRDEANLNSAQTPLLSLVTNRLAMCPSTVTFVGTRISVVENPAVFRISRNNNSAGTYSNTRDVTNMAILWACVTNLYARRQIYTRGTPDDCVVAGNYLPTSAFASAASAWANNIIANGWAIRTIDRTQPIRPISTVDTAGVMTLLSDHGWVVGDVLKFQRARFTDGTPVKKTYTIGVRTSGTNYTLVGWPAGKTLLNVRARKLTYFLDPPTFIAANTATTRKTGRPFGLRAGRRRVVAR